MKVFLVSRVDVLTLAEDGDSDGPNEALMPVTIGLVPLIVIESRDNGKWHVATPLFRVRSVRRFRTGTTQSTRAPAIRSAIVSQYGGPPASLPASWVVAGCLYQSGC